MAPFIEFTDGERKRLINASFIVEAEFYPNQELLKIHATNGSLVTPYELHGSEALAAFATIRKLKK